MTQRLWSLKELQRLLRYEDPEVRCWAAERIVRHYPDEASQVLIPFLFDEHEITPELVANHLANHGGAEHIPQLARAVGTLRGRQAGKSLEALLRMRHREALKTARGAFERRDFDEECWSGILGALAAWNDEEARGVLAAFLKRRADWFGSPAILKSALQVAEPGNYHPLLQCWMRSLQWRGVGGASGDGSAGEAFRVLTDHLQIDDCGWCFRTSLSGRIDFDRTLKAIESSYDCEVREVLGHAAIGRLTTALEGGAYEEMTVALADAIRLRGSTVQRTAGDDLPDRIVEVAAFWADPEVARLVESLGPHLREWVVGWLLSALAKIARYRNYQLEIRRAAGDLGTLLPLMELETSFMVDPLPVAIRRAVDAAGPEGSGERSTVRRMVEDHCLAILAARGPFFPQMMALETLGELRSIGTINEILDFLAEDNAYLYEAAEHALSKMGEALIEPVAARLEAGNVEEDAGHSLLTLLGELGTREALDLVIEHFDFFLESTGPGEAARWMSQFGARELIKRLRAHLDRDKALVGQALLLLAGIHNVRVPEEAEIRRAIDEFWRQHSDEGTGDFGPGDGSDKYLM
jgi:hypothetical protein